MKQKGQPGWIYVLDSNIHGYEDSEVRFFKIGRAKSLTSRVKQFDTAYAFKPTITYAFQASDYVRAEAELHSLFAEQRLNGEWFRLSYEDLTFIADYADNRGVVEDANGNLIPDFLMTYSEPDAIKAAIAELEADPVLARVAHYFPLQSCLDVPVCLIETEEETPYNGPTEEEEEEHYRQYLEECYWEEILQEEREEEREKEEERGRELSEDQDEDFIDFTEEEQSYLYAELTRLSLLREAHGGLNAA